MKVRKRPLVVDAELVGDLLHRASHGGEMLPTWVQEACGDGRLRVEADRLRIMTTHGDMLVRPQDFLIRGTMGEVYACEGETFWKIYVRID